jgi:hypothetical protein
MVRFPAFLFEVMDKMPTVAYMYSSGLILALLVFAATYFHRQFGLMTLLLVSLLCVQDLGSPDIVEAAIKEVGEAYVAHWSYSCRMTFILSVVLFFTAIILKRKLKQKNKLN